MEQAQEASVGVQATIIVNVHGPFSAEFRKVIKGTEQAHEVSVSLHLKFFNDQKLFLIMKQVVTFFNNRPVAPLFCLRGNGFSYKRSLNIIAR